MSTSHRAIVETSVPPTMELIASGPEKFCSNVLESWLAYQPLNAWQRGLIVEVIATTDPLPDAITPED